MDFGEGKGGRDGISTCRGCVARGLRGPGSRGSW
jgi:hypothetical protein